jgi:parvulin-like peptidyl-prolyl isomerase
VRIRPAEVRRYYEEHRDEFVRPPTALYRQVLFVAEEQDEEEAVRAEAEEALAEVRSGRDLAEIADGLSADRDTYPAGLHEVELPGEGDWLPPAVRGLEPGGPAELRRVAGGWAVVRLEEVRPARPAPFEEAQTLIRARLLRRRRAAAQAEFIARLEEEGRVEYLPAAAELGLP